MSSLVGVFYAERLVGETHQMPGKWWHPLYTQGLTPRPPYTLVFTLLSDLSFEENSKMARVYYG